MTCAELAGQSLAHQRACFVKANDFYLRAVAAVFFRDCIQGGNRGRVPEV